MEKADIGLIGLAVMGENLCLNMESRGFTVAVCNRTAGKVDHFLSGRAAGKNIIGCRSLAELTERLVRPRKILMMIRAGQAVDDTIERLIPLLEEGDMGTLEQVITDDDYRSKLMNVHTSKLISENEL